MILTEKQFVHYLNKIKEQIDKDDRLDNFLMENDYQSKDFYSVSTYARTSLEASIELLALASGDNAKDSWIEWWIYDNEFGTKHLEASLEWKGKKIWWDITSVEKLYNFLVKWNKVKNK